MVVVKRKDLKFELRVMVTRVYNFYFGRWKGQ